MSYYASFQGRVYLGERNTNGEPINVRSPGNVADLVAGQPAGGVFVHVDDVSGGIGHPGMGVGDLEFQLGHVQPP